MKAMTKGVLAFISKIKTSAGPAALPRPTALPAILLA